MRKVELRRLGPGDRAACEALAVKADQRPYIASNAKSLEEAAEYPGVARPFGIYAAGTMVGFLMLAFDLDNEDPEDRFWLWRLMIDRRAQGKGYGRAALAAAIDYFRAHGADIVTLSTKADNAGALGLYHQFGFAENGQKNGQELVLKLRL